MFILAQGNPDDLIPKEPEKINEIGRLFDPEIIGKLMVVGPVYLIGVLLIIGITGIFYRVLRSNLNKPQALGLLRFIRWGLLFLITVFALNQFNIKVGALLGAAGVLGLAVGFAAQTSLSNIIAGLFLRGEKPFKVGDIITVSSNTGTVDSIDFFSVTLRTFDNKSVRIPNETLVKTDVTNVTRYPIRRCDIDVGVDYDTDIFHVIKVLRDIALQNYQALDEPEPLILFKGFGTSSLDFMLGAWCTQDDYTSTKNSLAVDIQKRFAREGIAIPYPHIQMVRKVPPALTPAAPHPQTSR